MPSDNIKFYEPNVFDPSKGATASSATHSFGFPENLTDVMPIKRVLDLKNRESVEIASSNSTRTARIVDVRTKETVLPGPPDPGPQPSDASSLFVANAVRVSDALLIGNFGPPDNDFAWPTTPPWTQEALARPNPFARGNDAWNLFERLRNDFRGIILGLNSRQSISRIFFADANATFRDRTERVSNPAFIFLHSIRFDQTPIWLFSDGGGLRVDYSAAPYRLTSPNFPREGLAASRLVIDPSLGTRHANIGDLSTEIQNMPEGEPFTIALNFFYQLPPFSTEDAIREGYILSDAVPPYTPAPAEKRIGKKELADTIILKGIKSPNIAATPGHFPDERVQGPSDLRLRMLLPESEFIKSGLAFNAKVVENFTIGTHNYGRSLICGAFVLSNQGAWTAATITSTFPGISGARLRRLRAIRQRLRGFAFVSNPTAGGAETNPSSVLLVRTESPPGTNVNPLSNLFILHSGFDSDLELNASSQTIFRSAGAGALATSTFVDQTAALYVPGTNRTQTFTFDRLPSWIRSMPVDQYFTIFSNYHFTETDPEPELRNSVLLNFDPVGSFSTDTAKIKVNKDDRLDTEESQTAITSISYNHGHTLRHEDFIATGGFENGGRRGIIDIRFAEPVTAKDLIDVSQATTTPLPLEISPIARVNNYIVDCAPVFVTVDGRELVSGFRIHVGYELRKVLDAGRELGSRQSRNFEINVNLAYNGEQNTFEEINNYAFRGEVPRPSLLYNNRIESVTPDLFKISDNIFREIGSEMPRVGLDAFNAPRKSIRDGIDQSSRSNVTNLTISNVIVELAGHENIAIKFKRSFQVSRTRIQTPGANEMGSLNGFIATESIGELKGFPEIKQFPFNQNETKVKTKDGRFFVNKQRETAKSIDLRGRNYAEIDDIELLKMLLNRDYPFLIWPNGGHQDFRFLIPGFDPEDFFKVQTLGQFRIGLAKGSYRGLMNFKIRFVESV